MSEPELLPLPSVEPDPPVEEEQKLRSVSAHEKLEAALNELIEAGEPFRLLDITSRAGTAESAIYKYVDLKAKAQAVIAERKPKQPIKRQSPRSTEKLKAKCEAVLAELVATGKPFSRKDVESRAGLHSNFLHKYQDLKERVKQASEASRKAVPSQSDLEARIEELEQRNRELRVQLQEKESAQPQPVVQLAPIDWLQGECQHWELQVERNKAEVARIMQAYTAAQDNLLCYQRLLKLHEVEVIGPEPSSNGNGHKAEVTA